MGWIKRMDLKKALFTLAFLHVFLAVILSLLSFWGCMCLSGAMAGGNTEIQIIQTGEDVAARTEYLAPAAKASIAGAVFSVLQIVLPMVFFIVALFATASLFYRWKLREPLAVLSESANRIMENDLDFTLEAQNDDELGKLCLAFETMRRSLLKNNRELWRQAQERKRLNAAFSHDLRNPVTVLKGTVKIAMQCVAESSAYWEQPEGGCAHREQPEERRADTELLAESLARMESYISRMERYVEVMSNAQRLEQIQTKKAWIRSHALAEETEKALQFAAHDSGRQLVFQQTAEQDTVFLDKNMFFQIAENLVSNAMGFAKRTVWVSLTVRAGSLTFRVEDDGAGFPAKLLNNGVQPFQKGDREDGPEEGHFGMGLYICSLLCQKHGGQLKIANTSVGAEACAVLKVSGNAD